MTKLLPFFLLLFAYGKANCDTLASSDIHIIVESYPDYIEFSIEDENYELLDVKCSESRMLQPNFVTHRNILDGVKKCTGLKPCTTYEAIAIISNKTGNNSFEQFLSVKTTYDRPYVEMGEIVPSAITMSIEWKSINPTCIKGFSLKVEADWDSKTTEIADNMRTRHLFDKLQPCLTYRITLIVTDKLNKLITLNEVSTTLSKEPGEIEEIKFANNTDGKSIKVSWSLPPFYTCVKNYFLQWECDYPGCELNVYNITNAKVTDYVLENVNGCSKYKFAISANGIQPNTINEFYTGYIRPLPISDFKIKNNSYVDTEFSWKVEKHQSCIKHYKLNIIGPNIFEEPLINRTEIISDMNYKVPDKLEACGEYNITINAIFKTETLEYGESFHKTLEINEEKPSEILNTTVKYIYPTEIVIQYNKSAIGGLCIEKYRINCWPKDHTEVITNFFDRDVKSFIIKHLASCMEYEVQIIPITRDSIKEGDPVVLPVTTSSKVIGKPELDNPEIKTYNSIQLRGGNKDKSDRCEVLFAKFECKSTHDTRIHNVEKTVRGEDTGVSIFTAIMHPLSPYSKYHCSLRLFNDAGWSSEIGEGIWSTESYFPEIPTSIEAKTLSNSSFNIKWLPPKYINGNLHFYSTYILYLGPAYELPQRCQKPEIKFSDPDIKETQMNHTEALPYSLYTVQIATTNDFGTGEFSSPVYILTEPSASEPVDDFSIVQVDGPEIGQDEYKANVTIKWRPPCKSNGIINYYILNISDNKPETEPREVKIQNHVVNDTGYIYWSDMMPHPEYNYTMKLAVLVNDVSEKSEERIIEFTTPAGIPEKIPDPEKLGSVDSFSSKNPTNSAVVKFSKRIFESNMGKIVCAALLLSEMSCQEDPELKAEKYNMSNGWPSSMKSYNDVKNEKCVSQYQTTPVEWQPFSVDSKSGTVSDDDDKNHMIEYIIGVENDCEHNTKFCNGPLKENTKYKMILRTFTKNGFRDSVGIEFKTDEVVNFLLIILLIVSVMMIAFFLGFIYLWVMKRKLWNRQSLNGIEDAVGDVSTKNFLIHYSKLSAKDKVQREFKDLAVVAQDVCVASTISKYNESKNRYSNIYPYEKNRVILNIDSEGSDYINASFINGYKHRKEYIATQGPKPESFIDFWKMIIEYNVKVVVMVTQFVEGNMIKCHQYFPLINGNEMKFGNNITILCRAQTENEIYERRELIVKHGIDEVQTVIHYLFKRWPDHDVPSDPTELITFVKRVKSERIPSRSPIVVHCSAGVGRTGTFIALDLIMQRIKNEYKVNIYETVKSLRFQRMKMVQSIHQYQFLYNCTLVLVKRKYEKSKTAKLFFIKSNSSLFQQADGNNSDIQNSSNNNNRLNNGICDTKLKNNLSNNSIISNGTIKCGSSSSGVNGGSSSSSGFSKSSRSTFNPNDIESVM